MDKKGSPEVLSHWDHLAHDEVQNEMWRSTGNRINFVE